MLNNNNKSLSTIAEVDENTTYVNIKQYVPELGKKLSIKVEDVKKNKFLNDKLRKILSDDINIKQRMEKTFDIIQKIYNDYMINNTIVQLFKNKEEEMKKKNE